MAQQQQTITRPKKLVQPKRFDIFFHLPKTFRLITALFRDPRVPLAQKLLFLGTILLLVVVLFFPDLLGEAVLSAVLPVLGTLLGVPIDAGVDWLMFAMLIVNLMHIFPAAIVSEHYRDIFGVR